MSNISKLHQRVKSYGISRKVCEDFLSSKPSYTLHRVQPRKFRRLNILSCGPRNIIGGDIAELPKLAKSNENVRYLVIFIDIFSKYAVVIPSKKKAGNVISEILDKAFSLECFRGSTHFFTDEGVEYLSQSAQKIYRKHGIKQYSTYNTVIKSSISERFIRTLKTYIHRYLTYFNTNRYIDVLNEIVQQYNKSTHSTLSDSPENVHFRYDKDRIQKLFKKMYTPKSISCKSNFKVGDKVRITSADSDRVFQKGYLIRNTHEIFYIQKVSCIQGINQYSLRDQSHSPIIGRFYKQELIKVQ